MSCGTPEAADSYQQAKGCAARAVSEAKTGTKMWDEFGEATKKDFQSYSGKASVASGEGSTWLTLSAVGLGNC